MSRPSDLACAGRVAGSHLTSMHSMDNYYVSKLMPLIAEAGVAAIANPLINITLQGRHDTYPKRRGMTRVPELRAAGRARGLRPRLRHGPLVLLGSGDMLEVAHMAVHVGQLTCIDAMRRCFRGGDDRARGGDGAGGLRPRTRLPRRSGCPGGRGPD